MSPTLRRRSFLAQAAAGTALAAVPWAPAIAQSGPARIGLLTVKTGPLAQGGVQMEQGLTAYLQDKGYVLSGRKVELISVDTGGNPAGAKTKVQELIERDHVDIIVGPLAAFELLAISDYIIEHRTPIVSPSAAADDITQRKPNPWFIRPSATSSQCTHALGDYAAKELKLRRVATVTEDFAFGYEQMGGFERVFEDSGGHIVKKMWAPIVTPDYSPYLAQMQDIDGVCIGFAGSNPVKFMQQSAAYGLVQRFPVVGGWTAFDDALLKSFSDDAVGAISAAFYSATYDSPSNKHFVDLMVHATGGIPGGYAAGCYITAMCIEAALAKTGGSTEDKEKTMAALRAVSLADSPRGPFHFDHLGNVVGNVFIRKLERSNGALANVIVKIYPDVSQFWTYDETKYLAAPVYTRDQPPAKL